MKILTFLSGLVLTLPALAQTCDTTTFRAEEVSYWNPADSVKLVGTLTIPNQATKHRFPAALLITGSGAQDRDETILGHKPFKVIAEYLSARGFAVLRVDDRGTGQSSMGRHPKEVTSVHFAGDVSAGIAFLKTRPDIAPDRIGLIGHSEGGLIAPLVAVRSPSDVAFIVSLAGTGVSGGTILKMQLRAGAVAGGADSTLIDKNYAAWLDPLLDESLVSQDTARLRAVAQQGFDALRLQLTEAERKKLGQTPQMEKYLSNLYVKMVTSPWMRYFIAHDPAENWRRVTCPVLALNGTLDRQVDAELNLQGIERALKAGGNTRYQLRRLPGQNHLFQHAKTGAGSEYGALKEDFSTEALEAMGAWLAQFKKNEEEFKR